MSDPDRAPPDLRDLIDDYLDGSIDEAGLAELESRLLADGEARRRFVRYSRLHTDLHLAARASRAGKRALQRITSSEIGPAAIPASVRRPFPSFLSFLFRGGSFPRILAGAAAAALIAWVWVSSGRPREGSRGLLAPEPSGLAWLVNAQDCQWAADMSPAADMGPGRTLRIERGLAELGFRSGARLVLEGPASLELVSSSCARLIVGKATARVPGSAKGFTLLSPQGRVVDLGTEFGMAVEEDGDTRVLVFEGQVEAFPGFPGGAPASSVTLGQNDSVVLSREGVVPGQDPGGGGPFVREIVPRLRTAPRTRRLEFRGPFEGTLRDLRGAGTGLTHRLPGTGLDLRDLDPNLELEAAKGHLALTTTNSDINTQYRLGHGEYLGVRLADLGFKGTEDFAVTVSMPDIPKLEFVGQFGLYAGARSDRVVRGGLISTRAPDSYSLFLVNNSGGRDADLYEVGLSSTGDDLRLTLRRVGGRYSLTVENRTTGGSSTLAIRHPGYLDGEADLFVGAFGANTQSEVRKTLVLQEFEVTVWTAEE
ncbi:MAG: FecR domain-containing protein [Planctomycetes bacterium]|nr:FecR domain-containing protein [Planctomycetota bacterium]